MKSLPVLICAWMFLTATGAARCQSGTDLPPAPVPAPSGKAEPPPAPKRPLQARPPKSPEEQAEALRVSKLARINGVPYDQPSTKNQVIDYVRDTYGVSGQVRSFFRAGFAQARGKPTAWDQNWAGFGARLGSSEAITIINGNVRLGMELLLHEDLRYLPCNSCSAKKKIENALLAEVTARHDKDGHRFFTLTPTIADFSGPLIAHSTWYPGTSNGPVPGFVSARLVFATRIGEHLVKEFFFDPTKKTRASDKAAPAPAAPAH